MLHATTRRIVEVESKGTVTDEPGLKPISSKKGEIEAKKRIQRAGGNSNQLVGIITKFPTIFGARPRCYLLDPPSFGDITEPRKHKLLARLLFYLREVNMILPARFLIALSNRINDLANVAEYDALDDMPLLTADGDQFEVPGTATTSRSIDPDRTFFGEVFPFTERSWFFYGFDLVLCHG